MPTIKSETWDGVVAPAIPSGWTVDPQLVTATTGAVSAPNALDYLSANIDPTGYSCATWGTQDGNNGRVQVSSTFNLAATAQQQDIFLFARSATILTRANLTSGTYYEFGIERSTGIAGIKLGKRVSGTETILVGPSFLSAIADGTNYRFSLICDGSTITGKVQRLSDSLWLNSTGSFVSDPSGATAAMTVVDTSVAGQGYAGLWFYANTAAGNIVTDDWLLETYATPSISASPSTLQAGAGPQTVALSGTNTAFSTTSSTQFTLSGGTGAALVSQSAQSATAATLVVNPGSAGGTLTIADVTDAGVTTTIAVTPFVAPTAPAITLHTASGLDTITISAPSSAGTYPVAGYRLYKGPSSGAEADTGETLTSTTFPVSFPAQATAAAGQSTSYTVKAYDTATTPNYSAASNEVYSRTTLQEASGEVRARVFCAPYGTAHSGLALSLGFIVYDPAGAILVSHTTGQTTELGAGSGIYAASVSLDGAYSGVLVWDAPAGVAPVAVPFEPGLPTVHLDLAQSLSPSASGLSVGRALLAAIAGGVGAWTYDPVAKTLVEYAEDGTTVLRSFALSVDASGTITRRA